MPVSRRRVVRLSGLSAAAALAGCTVDRGTTETPPGTTRRTPTPESTPSDLLPDPNGEWELTGTEDWNWRMIGGVAGTIGEYDSPDGTLFKVVVMDSGNSASDQRAEEWACNGWDVVLAYRTHLFAAGTGTTEQTFTPEQPPHMTKTPVPGSENESRELLTYSPLLDDGIIEEHRRRCPR